MMTFGPVIGASAIPPAAFGGGSTMDLTVVLVALVALVAGVAAALTARFVNRSRRAIRPTRIVTRAGRAPVAA